MSCKLSEETKGKLIQLVAKQGETLNAHLVELVEADVQMMEESEKESSNPGNPGPSSEGLVECPECAALVSKSAFKRHFDSLHQKAISQAEFENILGKIIEERGGKKFSESEIGCLKAIHRELHNRGLIKEAP